MKETKLSSLRAWFNEDRNGYWYKETTRLIESCLANPKAVGMPKEEVDRQIATMLCWWGAEALLKEAKH